MTKHMHDKAYTQSRQSMIDSQIHPMGVTDEGILSAFATTPREMFVPDNMKNICYADEDIQIRPNCYLMEPSVFGRLLQAIQPHSNDVALTIGAGAGYAAAVLSCITSTVIALDDCPETLTQAQESWNAIERYNIVGMQGVMNQAMSEHAPYDIIMINGAVYEIPETFKAQLAIGGRLAAIIRADDRGLAQAVLIERQDKELYSQKILFECGTPYLKGFEPKSEFVF